MPRGGFRPGAGRPKGSKNTTPSAAADKLAARRARDPLAYMLEVMNNPEADPWRRDRMAIAAAAFVHPVIRSGSASPFGVDDD